jgi:tetratricopeptide (TPR) repeat protein
VGVALIAYANSLTAPFLFDDEARITENPSIRRLWPPWDSMAHETRPLVQLSLALNHAFGGFQVLGYHAFNLAVHLAAGLALYGLVRRTLQSERLRARYGASAGGLALAVAAIWLVHPLQTESVTYIIQRAESLMGLWYLLMLYCGARGAASAHPFGWYAGAVAACALGMGSKEVMVTAPITMLLYDRMFLARSFREIMARRWGLYAGLTAAWALLGVLLATRRVEEQTVMVAGLTPWRYALTQFGIILHYLRLSVWPHPLILDYTWPLAASWSAVLVPGLVVLALVAGSAVAVYREAWAGFWGAWFFLILAPTSSVYPIADLAFEHRMYLPLAAVVVLVVVGTHEALDVVLPRLGVARDRRRWVKTGLAVVVVILLSAVTLRRNEDYQSPVALWGDTAARRPENPRAHYNLGVALYKQREQDAAITQFTEAVRLKPDYVEAHNNLGSALYSKGEANEAIGQFREALRLKPDFAVAHRNLGRVLVDQGHVEEGITHLEQAVRLKKEFADALDDLRRARRSLAETLVSEGRSREAAEALQLTPGSPEAHNDLGRLLYRDGRLEEAIGQYSEALRLKPDFPEAHLNLGLALARQGDVNGAADHFAEAVRLKPDYAQARNNLGIMLHRQGRIDEAIAQFSEAVRLDPAFRDARNNLQAALAAAHQPREGR